MPVPNLGDAINWQLVSRESNLVRPSSANKWEKSYLVDRPRIQIGITPSNPTYKWGGKLRQYSVTRPSTTSEFVAVVLLREWENLQTKNLQLIELENYDPRPWVVILELPRWFQSIPLLEVWKYNDPN